jgi:hypothetical protein
MKFVLRLMILHGTDSHFTRFLWDAQMATILVGPDETNFVVHQAVLCDKSPYFAKALTGSFEESKIGIVNLEDVSPVLFKIVVSWLYCGKIIYTVSDDGSNIDHDFAVFKRDDELMSEDINADNNSTWPRQILVELYVLADRLDIRELRTNTIDAVNNSLMHSKLILSVSSHKYISLNTTAQSPLRRLVVDHLAYLRKRNLASLSFWTALPHDITVEVLMKVGARVPVRLCSSCYQKGLRQNGVDFDDDHPCKDEDKTPFTVDMCFYHEHADEEEKKACQANCGNTVNK